MGSLLIENALIVPVDDNPEENRKLYGPNENIHGQKGLFYRDIAIKDGLFLEIGTGLKAKYPDYPILSGKDTLAMPGLINCHTHAAMTLFRSYADDLPLMEWLNNKIWPLEAHLTAEDIYWGTMLSILEMIQSGTTTFADMYFFMEQVAQAAADAGIRACLARGLAGGGESTETALRESEELVQKWQGGANGRITCLLGPHAPYTCSPDLLRRVMQLADRLGVGLHIHLAETRSEVEQISAQYGLRPVEYAESVGLFENRHVVAAHCVYLSEKEMDILAKRRVGIAHNPQSNMKLASGIAPIPELLKKGALVGLGTDGASSNNNLDMFEEMQSCSFLHKVHTLDPTNLPAWQVLKMATANGAQVLGLEDLGSIRAGYKADLLLLDLHRPHLVPLHDPIANIVYAVHSSDVKTVIIDGEIIMKDRQMLTMDTERIIFEANRQCRALLQRK
jgi:5-methylthioadenosine/S-adenosylhomocysteine deaminase